ncbi:hypothetical protein K470DRAFT_111564 [Piedraia hortae CBS 480.64]|uniref:TAP-C domain-containing protein n=1 Tax=Piedraia hortae CBS 480.64 TaxID=1314780 RepID=A0A6A7BWH5_9PEZI|nr:hypothetical protein K470DRAFT_111564 [Piedraia hortae CBS 480.64]
MSKRPWVPQRVSMLVTGWEISRVAKEADGGLSALLGWLSKKTNGAVIDDSRVIGLGKLVVTISSRDERAFSRIDGYKFANAFISVQPYSPNGGDLSETGGVVSVKKEERENEESKPAGIDELIRRCYSPKARMLNLSALNKIHGFQFIELSRNESILSATVQAVLRTLPLEDVKSVWLAQNSLANLKEVAPMLHALPALVNLDLSLNAFTRVSALKELQTCAPNLVKLNLNKNPIMQREERHCANMALMSWLPRLEMINGELLFDTRNEMLQEFARLTRLTDAYCRCFLEHAGWDLHRALERYDDRKDALASVAFLDFEMDEDCDRDESPG